MDAVRVGLLLAAVAGVLLRPGRLPGWAAPAAAVALGLGLGAVELSAAAESLEPLVEPVAFLLAAVPLAVMLDGLGFFAAAAAVLDWSRNLPLGLWLLAAATTTLLNLDAAVVLLTPLYIRVADRHGLDPLALAYQPALLASLASSALPVSNLTNLLAAERFGLGATDFLLRLGPASAVAVAVGWLGYRRVFDLGHPTEIEPAPLDRRALGVGSVVVAFLLVGFTVGDGLGVPASAVAVTADIALVALTGSLALQALPLEAAGIAAGLGVLAAAAASVLPLEDLLDGSGAGAELGMAALSVIGANAMNNLPALLVALPALGPEQDGRLWALLVGVNVGPVLVATGALSTLLWLSTVRRLGLEVSPLDYSRVGLRVGLPALVAAVATTVGVSAAVG